MIAKIIEFSVRNRWLVIFVWLGIAIWGLWAVLHTPVDAIPDLSENQVIVFADWMGRSPQDIEEQVTYPLSVQLQGLAGVKAVRASSEFNFSMITVIFDEKTDFYFARQRVLEKLTTAQTQMPAGVVPYMAPDATALGQIFWYTVEGDGKSLDELRAVQDFNVKYQLASVAGVSEVASVGGMVREYQIDLDPQKMKALELPLGQVYSAVANSNLSVGGKIIVENSSEYVVRATGWLKGVEDLENTVVANRNGTPIYLRNVATIQMGPEFRRSALEKNGREVVGGVVMMRYGQNPLEVTKAVKEKIREMQAGLPAGVRIVPFYDRTRLIESAIHTLTGTLAEEMIIASLAIVLILTHFRSALVVCVTLPMAVLVSFLFMYYLAIPSNIMSLCGIAISIGILVDAAVVMVENASHELRADAEARVLVGRQREDAKAQRREEDEEKFSHRGTESTEDAQRTGELKHEDTKARKEKERGLWGRMYYGKAGVEHAVVSGDTTEVVVRACRLVGRPIFFSVVIMLISFLPVFAFGGQEGKLAHPLAFTKSFAMVGVSLLAITLVPALIPIFIRGRIRGEEENWIVRSFIHIYKPTLSWIIDRPAMVWWLLAVILALAAALLGTTIVTVLVLAGGLVAVIVANKKDGWTAWLLIGALAAVALVAGVGDFRFSIFDFRLGKSVWVVPAVAGGILLLAVIFRHWRTAGVTSLLVVTFLAGVHFPKLGSEFMPDLNEGSIMDMPTSAPRIALGQAVDDVMVRDRILRGYPEVSMVVGKIGRADTATDPSPLDMVETIVTLQPTELWPKRKLRMEDAAKVAGKVAGVLQRAGRVKEGALPGDLVMGATAQAMTEFDDAMRAFARQRQMEEGKVLGRELTRVALERLMGNARQLSEHGQDAHATKGDAHAVLREPSQAEVEEVLDGVGGHGDLLVESLRQDETDLLLADLKGALVKRGVLADRDDLLIEPTGRLEAAANLVRSALGSEPQSFAEKTHGAMEKKAAGFLAAHLKPLNWELFDRAGPLLTRVLAANILLTTKGTAWEVKEGERGEGKGEREEMGKVAAEFGKTMFLWQKTKADLVAEMDGQLQVPGWGNAWTQPIINRVNMLATGVRTQIGIKIYGPTGRPLEESVKEIQRVSQEVAAKLRGIPGAVDVNADQAVGKRYLEITIDRERAGRFGVAMGDISQAVETALGGSKVTMTIEGRQRFPVRLRYTRENWQDIESVKGVLVSAQVTPALLLELSGKEARSQKPEARSEGGAKSGGGMGGGMGGGGGSAAGGAASPMGGGAGGSNGNGLELPAPGGGAVGIPLSMVADIRVVEGPSMIKSENGRLRNYVTLNVRADAGGNGRDLLGFVEEARQALKPIEKELAGTGMSIEFSGEYEAQVRATKTMAIILPLAVALIFFLLYVTFRSLLDSLVVLLAVLGAFAGAIMFQGVFGFNRSVVVWIAYVSVIGMATQTGVIMMVYLREAIDRKGGLGGIGSLEELRAAVIDGAVHRLRPKLLTEGVAIVGLVPMLWATGTGAEVMRPMAAPVLGGLLISDEVIDLMVPVLFYWIRRRQWERMREVERVAVAGG